MKFYNREKELEILQRNEEQSKQNAVFTVMTGRRRVGKTSLILRSLQGKDYAYLLFRVTANLFCAKSFRKFWRSSWGYMSMVQYSDSGNFLRS